MKKWLVLFLISFASMQILAQAPLGFNYQGIARQADGTPIAGQNIGVKVSIIDGPQGNSQFVEEHFLQTNEFGLFTTVVGQGSGNSTLNSVDWALGNLWLQIELDPDNSGSYILMGSQQLMSVPYALFAQQSGEGLSPGYGISVNEGTISNILPDRPISIIGSGNLQVTGEYPNFNISSSGSTDADADPTNEFQTISKVGSTVTLSDGGGTFTDAVNDADFDATNEIQDLQLVGNDLEITNNGTATTIGLSGYLDNTDSQNLSSVLSNGTSAANSKITNLGYPTLDQDAASKKYVDDQDGSQNTNIASNSSAISTNITNISNNTANIGSSATNIASNSSAISTEVVDRAAADTGLQAELDASQTGAGLDANGGYTPDGSTAYIAAATSLKNADKLLDTKIEANSSSITTLTGRLDNTYAFQADFSLLEGLGANQVQVNLSENLDSFNQIASNEIVVGATGLYIILVDAERIGTESSLSNLQVRVNATDYTISVSALDQNVARTLMLNLSVGDIITLRASTSIAMSITLNGIVGGYKISD